MINFDECLARVKKMKGFSSNKEIARMFGISEPDFSRRKKKGTLLPLIIAWGLKDHVDLDWLLTGREKKQIRDKAAPAVAEQQPVYGMLDADLLRGILSAVEEALAHQSMALPPGKKAEVISLLYELYGGSGNPVSQATVLRYLSLAAGKNEG